MHRSCLFDRTLPLLLLFFCVGGALSLTTGCDPSAEILSPSDRYRFSLFGVLNVSADTQIVRVEPLGDTTQIGTPPTLPATVLLENLDTGTQVTLNDSFVAVGNSDIRVHNFWTTHSIHPSTSYRVSVQKEGETVTTASTRTPANAPDLSYTPEFYLPCIFPPPTSSDDYRDENTFTVTVRHVESVAAAQVIYPITIASPGQSPSKTLYRFDHYDALEEKDTHFEVPIFYRPDLAGLHPTSGMEPACIGPERFTHPYAMVAVAAGGPDWPEWQGASLDEIARPDTFSNVQGGHGFVGGVYSDTIRVPLQERPP